MSIQYEIVATVAAVLTKVLPLRTLQLLGGLVIASGVCISSLATSNLELMLTYGVYTGRPDIFYNCQLKLSFK